MTSGAVSGAGRPRSLGGTGSARSWTPQARWRLRRRGRGVRRWGPRRRRSLVVQGFAQPHNVSFELGADSAGVVVGATRVWFERRCTLGLVALDQLLDPPPRDLVLAGHFAFAASLKYHGGDDELRLRHGRPPTRAEMPTMSRDSRQLCRETRSEE